MWDRKGRKVGGGGCPITSCGLRAAAAGSGEDSRDQDLHKRDSRSVITGP